MFKITFRDLTLLMVLGFVVMLIWVLPFVTPPAKDDAAEPPGNLLVHILWPPGDSDIDLWVSGPGETTPVGYANKGGSLWNLLRDDLGNSRDATPLNYENAYTRGIVPGEYVINVHCYRCPTLPQKVDVEVSQKTDDSDKSSMKVLVTTSLQLFTDGQERTAIRFRLDDRGNLVPGSLNSVFMPLRVRKK